MKDGKTEYEVRLASAETDSKETDYYLPYYAVLFLFISLAHPLGVMGTHQFKGTTVVVTRGDYAPIMKRVNDALAKARQNTSNTIESDMLKEYIASFDSGNIECHKNGSRHWIKNKGPIVET